MIGAVEVEVAHAGTAGVFAQVLTSVAATLVAGTVLVTVRAARKFVGDARSAAEAVAKFSSDWAGAAGLSTWLRDWQVKAEANHREVSEAIRVAANQNIEAHRAIVQALESITERITSETTSP